MKHYLILYGVTLVIMVALDLTWIGGIAREFYKNRLGDMLEFHAMPGIVFYLLYVLGILVFVTGGEGLKWSSVLLYGAFYGLVAYGTYDLTNLATLRGWPASLGIVDMLWGTCVTAVAASGAWLLTAWIERMLR